MRSAARRCLRAGHQGKRTENSLLVLITDRDGEILASADEHSALYTRAHDASTGSGDNSYRAGEALSWQAGAQHSLPTGYADFLARLQASESGTVGYRAEDGASFVCGTALSALDAVLYMSAPLGAVGAAAGIPPQELPHIRERYFTARERGGRGGTGLGLAITGELLTACGARFGAQNVQDAGESGCIFWFELPACADSPDAMPRSSEDDVLEPGKAENTACD